MISFYFLFNAVVFITQPAFEDVGEPCLKTQQNTEATNIKTQIEDLWRLVQASLWEMAVALSNF